MIRVLFVCTGNICRSPMAEGLFRKLVQDAGLGREIGTDSAGTHAWRLGQPPDPLAQELMAERGIDIGSLRARLLEVGDFARFQHILVMDRGNYDQVSYIRPQAAQAQLDYLLRFAPRQKRLDVPDPFGGGRRDFERVLALIEAGVTGLFEDLRTRLGH